MNKKKYSKVVFLPVIALVMLTAQKILDVEFTTFEIQILTDGLLALAVMIGIMSDPHQPEE